ncbi:alpha/beta fold hydrolase [Dermatophilus congolensis]|uniref:alpha/beta fold hydrolase n=1 Tax=Dermatophilus congolensis TaxID=1863 RepID=UPI001AB05E83|nr:alpha/beta fold hydrolase [Dermatophilus congolensis]MBO3143958.1 alpha/beta hydrolase [Dermatophilus congolensis]
MSFVCGEGSGLQAWKGQVEGADGVLLGGYVWRPCGQVRGVVYLVHGMAEHAGRYAGVAEFLVGLGWAVCAQDQRGHGRSVGGSGHLGHVEGGWDALVGDVQTRLRAVAEEFPGVPLVVVGHSMGSFVVREVAMRHAVADVRVDGFVFVGSGGSLAVPVLVTDVLLGGLASIWGWARPCGLMDRLVFGGYNAQCGRTRTGSDWLSVRPQVVDAYEADPLAGHASSLGLWRDLVRAVGRVNRRDGRYLQVPVLFLSGVDDPVGGMGVGVRQAAARVRGELGAQVECVVLPGERHEVLNGGPGCAAWVVLERWLGAHWPVGNVGGR